MTETNDADNDVYRNAATKATMIAKVDRYSQGTFDLSLLIGGNNANSYFTGKLNSATDVDYFHVDTMSQMMNHRPVIINMEMPERADYDLTVYDEAGNQVGIAVENEDGTKTLAIPCDWSNSHNFVIKVSQNGSEEYVEGNYKLTFSQGEMPQEVKDALERIKTAKLVEGDPKRRAELGAEIKAKNDARNVAETEKLHQAQYDALPEELQYKGSVSVEELLEKEMHIVGLPLVIASALNSADSTDKYYDYKQMIHSILNYKQQNGEIPQYHMDFKWSGKELQC